MQKKVPSIEDLRDASSRRALTPNELGQLQHWLRSHPEEASAWEQEMALTDSLRQLADVPVATNFTARVMAAVQKETPVRRTGGWLWRWSWLPRVGFAVVLIAAGLLSYHGLEQSRRAAYQETFSVVSGVGPLPSAQALEDFDAIQALSPAPAADDELLALMQ